MGVAAAVAVARELELDLPREVVTIEREAGERKRARRAEPVPGDEPDVGRIQAIVRAAVRRKAQLFTAWREIGEEDLMQIATARALADHAKFDPTKGARYNTWITRVASFALIDAWRARGRRANGYVEYVDARQREHEAGMTSHRMREARDAMLDWMAAGEGAGLPGGAGGDDETLDEWLARVYLQARRTFPRRRGRRGRDWFSPAQVVAVVLLMRRRKLSVRGARLLLLTSPELRDAIRLRHVPTHTWFWSAQRYARRVLKLPVATAVTTPGTTAGKFLTDSVGGKTTVAGPRPTRPARPRNPRPRPARRGPPMPVPVADTGAAV